MILILLIAIKKTRISGEVYIYKLLLNSEQFKSDKWTMKRENGNCQIFNYKGGSCTIDPEDGSHYDIYYSRNMGWLKILYKSEVN